MTQHPYVLFDQPQPTSVLGPRYAPHIADYTELIGYSALGHLFLRNTATGDYCVFHTLEAGWKRYGPFTSDAAFIEEVLDEEGFASFVLERGKVKKLAERLGVLGDGQIYIPVPYPFLGGSGEIKTYTTGDIMVFTDIVGQMLLPDPEDPGEASA